MTPPKLFSGRRGWLFATLVGVSVLQAIGFAGTALATRAAFGALSHSENVSLQVLGLLTGSATLAVLAQLSFRVLAEAIGQDYVKSVRLRLFDHASVSPQSELTKRRRGYQFMRFIGDLSALQHWPGIGLPRLIQAMIILPVSTAVLFYLHVSFGWLAVSLIGVAAITLVSCQRQLLEAHRAHRAQRAKLAADMAERIPLAPQLHAAQRHNREAAKLSRQADSVAKLATRRRTIAEALKMAPDLAAGGAAAAILMIGAHNGLSTGTIAGALASLALIATPLRNVMATADKAAGFSIAYERLSALLQRPTHDSHHKQTLAKGPLSLELCLPKCEPVHIDAGQRRALEAGLLDQVTPFLIGTQPVPEGWIKVGTEDAAHLEPTSLGRRIARIDEHPLALKGSLRRALSLGLLHRPTDQQMIRRIEKADLGGALQALGGLDRRLAEGAADLSPREKIHLSALQAAVLRPGLLLVLHGADDPAIRGALNQLKGTQVTRKAA